MVAVSTAQLKQSIQQLLEQRRQSADMVRQIDQRLATVRAILEGSTAPRTGQVIIPSTKLTAKTGPKYHRPVFAITAAKAILAFVQERTNPTTEEIKQYLIGQGRKTHACNALNKLVNRKRLLRTPLGKGGGHGSTYTLLPFVEPPPAKKKEPPAPRPRVLSRWQNGEIDWRKRNFELVRELSVSRQCVSAMRKRYGFPNSRVRRNGLLDLRSCGQSDFAKPAISKDETGRILTSPVCYHTIPCPACKESFKTWHHASLNLQIDRFTEEYIKSVALKKCPHCGTEVRLETVVVGEDGIVSPA